MSEVQELELQGRFVNIFLKVLKDLNIEGVDVLNCNLIAEIFRKNKSFFERGFLDEPKEVQEIILYQFINNFVKKILKKISVNEIKVMVPAGAQC